METYFVVVNAQNDFLETDFLTPKPHTVSGSKSVCQKIKEIVMSTTVKHLILVKEEHDFMKENIKYCNSGTWGSFFEKNILHLLTNYVGNKVIETTNNPGELTIKTKGKCAVFVTGISHNNSVELVASNIKEQNPDANVFILKDYVAGGLDPFEVARGEVFVR